MQPVATFLRNQKIAVSPRPPLRPTRTQCYPDFAQRASTDQSVFSRVKEEYRGGDNSHAHA